MGAGGGTNVQEGDQSCLDARSASEVSRVNLSHPIGHQHLHGPVQQENTKLPPQTGLPPFSRPIADPLHLVCQAGET